jgi:hypothetical protein
MRKDEIQMTAEKERKLLEDIYEHVRQDEAEHLSDDDLAAYVMGLTDEDERQQLASHLASCQLCAFEMEELREATEGWRGQEAEQRLATLRNETRTKALAAIKATDQPPIILFDGSGGFDVPVTLLYPVNQVARPAFKTSFKSSMYQTADDLAAISFRERENGDLWIYIDSRVLDLEGRELVVSVKSKKMVEDLPKWRKTLRGIDLGEVGAKLVITREERQSLPEDSELSISLNDEEGDYPVAEVSQDAEDTHD